MSASSPSYHLLSRPRADLQYLSHHRRHPQLVRCRHLRANRHRGFQARRLQQPIDHLFPRDPDRRQVDPPR